MIDLSQASLDFECPRCGFYNPFTLEQVRLRDAIICRGCKGSVRLEDNMNETRKAIRVINRAMRELEQTLKQLGNITITV